MDTPVSCPLCESSQTVPAPHPDYASCQVCGLVFQFTDHGAVVDYYADEAAPDAVASFRHQAGSYRSYLRRVLTILGEDALRGRAVVDVGAGDATFLTLARETLGDRPVYAVDESATARSRLREQGVQVRDASDLHDIGPKVVFSLQVLEHVSDPDAFLSGFCLNAGDYVVLTSPATDAGYLSFYGRHWRSFAPKHHLALYGRESLTRLLQRNRIELLDYTHAVSGVHHRGDELARFTARLALWPLRYAWNPRKHKRITLFHGRNSFLAIGERR